MNPSWLEISLTVDGELAEAVAEVFTRYIPNGVAIESTAIYPEPDGEGYPIGPLRVCAYLPVDDHLEFTRRKIEEALWFLGRISPLPVLQSRTVNEEDWAEAWKVHYHPISIGQRLIIVPAWLESPDPSRVVIRMDPGMAFGTGTHPTTQLCLELLETLKVSETLRVFDVIDVGCGSGILAVAALKLGAGRGLGVDVDPRAVAISLENAALNGVAERYSAGVGSVAEILRGEFGIRQAAFVFANILASVLIRLFDEGLGELLVPGGSLILSGILADQVEGVLEAARQHGLELQDRRQLGDWVALCVKRG
jgi:ribosomal protein L11 methyltransferase